ncbi:hypothetical protein [Paraflavitalea sp. CAU 1676]|uniref:hypothetical protein n=1 Tax=Paraflavitalea sp. CAU 1676 TaxID=3032598 RepID=UPI0023DC6E97|nr:hypothetical protein [Paraflavitalea sp. CAU 1676]MDF2190261.1 hypothetical protein [Paraflavitalea sp. CAU 1676]
MPGKRNIAFLLAVFLLFACFLSLYYFYYIPSQRSALHQYGFSLLRRIQTNVQTGNTNLRRLYGTSIRKLQEKENDLALQEQLKRLTPAGTMLPEPVHVDTLVEKRAGEPIPLTDTSAYFMYAGAWQIVYPIYDAIHTRIVEVSTPISSLLDPCLGYRKEFFEGFLLVNTGQQNGLVLYGGEEFGMLEKLNGDSLLLLQKGGGFPQITDVALKGVPYKLFAWSVMLERQEVILCGVVRESTYHAQINTIPVKIVYPVIILLLLLVLGLPFLKLYFMNRKETLRSRDFTLGLFR